MNRRVALAGGALLVAALVWALTAYANATGRARLLATQLDDALDSLEVASQVREVAIATSDSLIALQDSIETAQAAAIDSATTRSDAAALGTDEALAAAVELAAEYPVMRDALILAQTELRLEREARADERATSAAQLFEAQQRNRTLSNQLLAERAASTAEIERLNSALSLSMQESDEWQRAARPGVLKSLWTQGRAAALVAVVIVALR